MARFPKSREGVTWDGGRLAGELRHGPKSAAGYLRFNLSCCMARLMLGLSEMGHMGS